MEGRVWVRVVIGNGETRAQRFSGELSLCGVNGELGGSVAWTVDLSRGTRTCVNTRPGAIWGNSRIKYEM